MGGRRWSEWIPDLAGLLNVISSQSAMCVGGRWSSLFKGFESEQLRAGYAEGSRLFYNTELFFYSSMLV